MTQNATTLKHKQFNKIMQEQKKLGYPDFKESIASDLVNKFNVSVQEAKRLAFLPKVNDEIIDDIDWAEHMGTNYWAKVIYEKFVPKLHLIQ